MAFRVADAKRAYDYALSGGAIAVDALYRYRRCAVDPAPSPANRPNAFS
jgi:hypothetical protein